MFGRFLVFSVGCFLFSANAISHEMIPWNSFPSPEQILHEHDEKTVIIGDAGDMGEPIKESLNFYPTTQHNLVTTAYQMFFITRYKPKARSDEKIIKEFMSKHGNMDSDFNFAVFDNFKDPNNPVESFNESHMGMLESPDHVNTVRLVYPAENFRCVIVLTAYDKKQCVMIFKEGAPRIFPLQFSHIFEFQEGSLNSYYSGDIIEFNGIMLVQVGNNRAEGSDMPSLRMTVYPIDTDNGVSYSFKIIKEEAFRIENDGYYLN